MDTNTQLESKWLGGKDLAQGKQYKLAIERVTLETLLDGTKKVAVWFVNCGKGWLLNKTNLLSLNQTLGAESDNWKGALVTIATMPVQYQGRVHSAIRVIAVEKPAVAQAPVAPAATVVSQAPVATSPAPAAPAPAGGPIQPIVTTPTGTVPITPAAPTGNILEQAAADQGDDVLMAQFQNVVKQK